MALSIKDPEVERLARAQAKEGDITITQAIYNALRDKEVSSARAKAQGAAQQIATINKLVEEFKHLPVHDARTPQEIIRDMWEE